MTLKKRIIFSIITNLILYIVLGFIMLFSPCTGFIPIFCRSFPLGIYIMYVIQFKGLIYNINSPGYFDISSDNFPNFGHFLIAWAIILWPFYLSGLISFLKKLKNKKAS